KAQKYFDSEVLTPNYVQVTDRRGTFAGWNLKVVEKTQFTQIDSGPQKYKVLKGATINLKSSETASFTNEKSPKTQTISGLIPGVETQVALASTGEGAGTWVIRWGNDSMVTEDGLTTAVSLFVPGDTPKDATAYTTTLNWILSDLPTNVPN
ncbi:MAG: WxL domain-containing protein, partial [Lactobacillus sp.]|nr:WxL domain-containing protein [Lactobacillus sp.]